MSALLTSRPSTAAPWSVAELSDDDLMHFVRAQDDREAFEELVHRHWTSVLRVARRRLGGDLHRAEDVVQEAFLRVHSARDRYEGSARFGAYLQRIVSNLCVSAQRRERARPAEALTPADQDDLRGREAELETWDRERELLPEALERLPELHREALVLYYQGDLSCEELGHRLGRSLSAVKSLLFRARESLRAALVELSATPLEATPVAVSEDFDSLGFEARFQVVAAA